MGDAMVEVRFDCVFYYVSDLDRAVRFSERTFGFTLASRDAVARFRVSGVLFELVTTNETRLFSGQGNGRLALAVDDLESAVAKLGSTGVLTSSIRVVANGRFVTLQDPDWNETMLWQYA
jgi:catechol 2,3-dioxygenase-like lactoylglutathione lyase family enzyme